MSCTAGGFNHGNDPREVRRERSGNGVLLPGCWKLVGGDFLSIFLSLEGGKLWFYSGFISTVYMVRIWLDQLTKWQKKGWKSDLIRPSWCYCLAAWRHFPLSTDKCTLGKIVCFWISTLVDHQRTSTVHTISRLDHEIWRFFIDSTVRP